MRAYVSPVLSALALVLMSGVSVEAAPVSPDRSVADSGLTSIENAQLVYRKRSVRRRVFTRPTIVYRRATPKYYGPGSGTGQGRTEYVGPGSGTGQGRREYIGPGSGSGQGRSDYVGPGSGSGLGRY